jgi:hypothetical protein
MTKKYTLLMVIMFQALACQTPAEKDISKPNNARIDSLIPMHPSREDYGELKQGVENSRKAHMWAYSNGKIGLDSARQVFSRNSS